VLPRIPGPLALAWLLAATPAEAEVTLTTTRVASNLVRPLFVTAPPGDVHRLFIVEQGQNGSPRILVLELATNTVLATPFLALTGIPFGDERGLLGMAFHPDYATNGTFYVYLSDSLTTNVLRSYRVSVNPDVADPTTRLDLLSVPDPFVDHNGGWIGFGPDGFLYVASGDGGSSNDPFNSAQDPTSLLGKILRIDVDGDDFPADPARNYAIPPTNPFAGGGGAPEVFHWGLRNPWRASFDRLTGDLVLGDVGQDSVEEVDFAPAGSVGLDFGWRCMEGNACTGLSGCTCHAVSLTQPISSYPHSSGCCVIGGYVYRGQDLCGLAGTYFHADYCTSRIVTYRYAGGLLTDYRDRTAELDPPGSLAIVSPSSFGEDARGELYVCDLLGGEVFKIVPGPITDCNGNGLDDPCDIEAGTSLDANGDGVPDECSSGMTLFCFGDGSSGACPCGNAGGIARGCQNSIGTGGAALTTSGAPRISHDELVLTSGAELPTATSIELQGSANIAPVGFGDGLRCAGGSLKRLYVKVASGGVVVVPGIGELSLSARSAALGDPLSPGMTRYYQTYYRDPNPAFCSSPAGGTFNATGGAAITWGI
jgi:glucose/arabinose dehydrogenase